MAKKHICFNGLHLWVMFMDSFIIPYCASDTPWPCYPSCLTGILLTAAPFPSRSSSHSSASSCSIPITSTCWEVSHNAAAAATSPRRWLLVTSHWQMGCNGSQWCNLQIDSWSEFCWRFRTCVESVVCVEHTVHNPDCSIFGLKSKYVYACTLEGNLVSAFIRFVN